MEPQYQYPVLKVDLGNLSHYLRFRFSHKNTKIQAVCFLLCKVNDSVFLFDVLTLLSLHRQKVGDNYGSKKADYQSRLTTSH